MAAVRDVELRTGRERAATEDAPTHAPEPAALAGLASAVGNAAFTRMVSSGRTLARGKDKSSHSLIKGHRESPYQTRHGPRPPSPEPGGRREGTRLYEQQQRAKEEGGSAPVVAPPPPAPEDGLIRVPVDNGVFFSGRRKELHWRDYDDLLQKLGDPIPDTAHRNRPLYLCEDGQRLPRKRDRIGKEDYADIDHVEDQYTWILKHGRTKTRTLADGHSYTAITLREAIDRYNDKSNLQLMSKKKNRGKKSGPKTLDRDMDMLHDSSMCDCCKRLSAGPPKKRDGGGGDGSSSFGTSAPIAVS